MARSLVLAEGALGKDEGKTAHGLLLHALQDEIVAVIDSHHAGRDAGDVAFRRTLGIPVVASYDDGRAFGDIERLYLGAAPVGGRLPGAFQDTILRALNDGLTIYSGLHTFLGDDPQYRAAAERGGGRLVDVRRPPETLHVADGRIFDCKVPRILVMGTDCAIGKRMTAVELYKAARASGHRAGFVATGQTGCMLGPDAGAVIDCIPSDFAAGTVERLVTEVAREKELVVLSGQGSVLHPAFSGVALSILHGSRPHAIVLQHDPMRAQRALFDHPAYRMPDLAMERALLEQLSGAKVVGIAVNGKDVEDLAATCAAMSAEAGVPVVDPLQMDVRPLLDAALEEIRRQAADGQVTLPGPQGPPHAG